MKGERERERERKKERETEREKENEKEVPTEEVRQRGECRRKKNEEGLCERGLDFYLYIYHTLRSWLARRSSRSPFISLRLCG